MLSLVLAFVYPPCAAAALCVEFASFLGYHAYLKMRFLLLMDKGAWALIAAALICAVYFILSLEEKNPKMSSVSAAVKNLPNKKFLKFCQ